MGKMKELAMEEQEKAFHEEERMSYDDAVAMAKRALNLTDETALVWSVADQIASAYHRGCMHGIATLEKAFARRGL